MVFGIIVKYLPNFLQLYFCTFFSVLPFNLKSVESKCRHFFAYMNLEILLHVAKNRDVVHNALSIHQK